MGAVAMDPVEALSASVVHLKRWLQSLPSSINAGAPNSGKAPRAIDPCTVVSERPIPT